MGKIVNLSCSRSPKKVDLSKLQTKSLEKKNKDKQILKELSDQKSYLIHMNTFKSSNDLKQRLKKVVGQVKFREPKVIRNKGG
jgi:hypothetical protein